MVKNHLYLITFTWLDSGKIVLDSVEIETENEVSNATEYAIVITEFRNKLIKQFKNKFVKLIGFTKIY